MTPSPGQPLPFNSPALPSGPFAGPSIQPSAQTTTTNWYGDAWLLPRASTLVGLFAAGAIGALLGAFTLEKTLFKQAAGVAANTLEKPLASQAAQAAERLGKTIGSPIKTGALTDGMHSEISTYYQETWISLARLLQKEPTLYKPVVTYAGVSTLSFLATNLLQGVQEAWVRFEESCIRAQLVERLKGAFSQSIITKGQMDDEHSKYAKSRLAQILNHHGIANPQTYLGLRASTPIPPAETRDFFYMPQNRQMYRACQPKVAASHHFGGDAPLIANGPPTGPSLPNYSSQALPWVKPLLKTTAVAVGALTGWLSYVGTQTLTQGHKVSQAAKKALSLAQAGQAEQAATHMAEHLPGLGAPTDTIKEFINANNLEGATLHLMDQWQHTQNRKFLWSLGGMFALGAVLGVGKLVVSGIREVSVTRLNAETEYNYEHYKWLGLDTMYHQTAERVQLEHALNKLEQKLQENPLLTAQPGLLKAEVDSILGNVGLWSPPPYYPITPSVQLAVARS